MTSHNYRDFGAVRQPKIREPLPGNQFELLSYARAKSSERPARDGGGLVAALMQDRAPHLRVSASRHAWAWNQKIVFNLSSRDFE